MNTLVRWFLLAPLLALGVEATLLAQSPPPAPLKGTVLLLQNERTMEGDILKNGSQYLIRRGSAEVTIQGSHVLRLCADWNEALLFMKSRVQLGDPDERLRLARWCHANNLLDEALAQAQAALGQRPNHLETKQLVTIFKRALDTPRPTSVAVKQTAAVSGDSPPAVDINNETLSFFIARVQPILLNTCANCHANAKGGGFQLSRPYAGNHRLVSQRNLTAALTFVDPKNPRTSPLLVKAVSLHGNLSHAPLKNQQSIPFRTLQEWVELAVNTNPHLQLPEHKIMAPLATSSSSTAPKAAPATSDPFAAAAVVVSHDVARVDANKPATTKAAPVANANTPAFKAHETPTKALDYLQAVPEASDQPRFPAPLPPALASVAPLRPVLGNDAAKNTPTFPEFAAAPKQVKSPPPLPPMPTPTVSEPTQTTFGSTPMPPLSAPSSALPAFPDSAAAPQISVAPAPPPALAKAPAPTTPMPLTMPSPLPTTLQAAPLPAPTSPAPPPRSSADTYDPTPFNQAMHPAHK